MHEMMSSTNTVLKAAFNRLKVRAKEKITNFALKIATITKDAPEQLRKEFKLFEDEVWEEVERLNREKSPTQQNSSNESEAPLNENIQEKVDRIRAKIFTINKKVEDIN